MTDLKTVIANNIRQLRTAAGDTQGELAAKLSYSDKAVSKWERGESLPDVQVLKQLADMYGVTVDYLLTDNGGVPPEPEPAKSVIRKNRLIITLLAVCGVWLAATAAYVLLGMLLHSHDRLWLSYIVALPVSCIVMLVFNSIWGGKKLNFVIISALVWSALLTVCLIAATRGVWQIFVIGIPAQLIILLCSRLKKIKK